VYILVAVVHANTGDGPYVQRVLESMCDPQWEIVRVVVLKAPGASMQRACVYKRHVAFTWSLLSSAHSEHFQILQLAT
jgi:hypothetical protein